VLKKGEDKEMDKTLSRKQKIGGAVELLPKRIKIWEEDR
jgi:hypothetical protein